MVQSVTGTLQAIGSGVLKEKVDGVFRDALQSPLTVITSDTFSVVNQLHNSSSDALLGGTPKTWAKNTSASSSVFQKSSGELRNSTGTFASIYVPITETDIVIRAVMGSGIGSIRLMGRVSAVPSGSTGTIGYFAFFSNGFHVIQDAGTGSISSTDSSALVPGDEIAFRIEGSTLTAYINDVQILTATDPTFTAGGYAGLTMQDTTVRLDSFWVEAIG